MPLSRNRRLELASYAALVAGAVPWIFTSDIPRQIVMERHVILGRYSLAWFAALAFLITPASLALFLALRARRTRSRAWILARLLALALALGVGIVLVDAGARLLRGNAYTKQPIEGATLQPGGDADALEVLRRKPNQRYEIRYVDEPDAARSYPRRAKGFPPLRVVLTTDDRGFRNATALERCDIITIGDSFTEGFFVSDDQSWPSRLGSRTRKTIYNLGVAGGDPEMYARTLRAVGLGLKPKTALVMLYEENDFFGRGAMGGAGAQRISTGLAGLARTSPVAHALQRGIIAWLGPVNSDAPVEDFAAVSSWMPVALPPEPGAPNYTFKAKRVMPLTFSRETFAASYGWTSTVPFLLDMKAACESAGVELVFVWAPSKARVVMSLIDDHLRPEQLHAFLRLRRRPLPDAATLLDAVRRGGNVIEETMRDFCRAEGIRLISPTAALRAAMSEGRQAYYTYDSHWTPVGHDIAARVVADALR